MINPKKIPLNGVAWSRFVHIVRAFVASELGWKAKILAALLIFFLFAINGFNVINSYVGRDFMTAVADRKMGEFVWQAVLYVAVFGVSTVLAVLYRFCEERLGLLAREWLTRRAVTRYMEHPVYYHLDERESIANPDQRIADDIKAFTVTTLAFVLMVLNGTFTIVAFSGVMWTINPLLFIVAVLYAAFGSYLTISLGRPLVWLNYSQLDKEANFRADLLHVRENAESIALLRREGHLSARILRRMGELVANFRQIIAVNRNLGFFTTGYNYLVQIIPALIVAPMFIRGEVEFGVITQSAIAFVQLLGAFSLIVTQFQSISSLAAVIARLGTLWEAIEKAQSTSAARIQMREDADGTLVYKGLTLRSPRDGRTLVKDLSLTVPRGKCLFISGPNERAKVALFRATAGIWDAGEGCIVRPGLDRMLLLPERPYLPPGTLREALLRAPGERVSDESILSAVHTLDLDRVVERAGGLDAERDWDGVLSLGE
jgi:putative ATP-binding cassette transporter